MSFQIWGPCTRREKEYLWVWRCKLSFCLVRYWWQSELRTKRDERGEGKSFCMWRKTKQHLLAKSIKRFLFINFLIMVLVKGHFRNTFLTIFLLFGYSFRNFLDTSQPWRDRRRSYQTPTKQRRGRFFLLRKRYTICHQSRTKKKQKQEQTAQPRENYEDAMGKKQSQEH